MKRTTQPSEPAWMWCYWHDQRVTIVGRSNQDSVISASYEAFIRGDAYTEYIISPDDNMPQYREADSVSTAWDTWLATHPDQRADWDTLPRGERIRNLKAQHTPFPPLFSDASILANPATYRTLFGALGLSGGEFDTLLKTFSESLVAHGQSHKETAKQRSAQPPLLPEMPDEELVLLFMPNGVKYTPVSQLVRLSHAARNTVRAAVYCRVDHPDDPFLEEQKRAAWKYCVEHGYRIAHTYVDTTPIRKRRQPSTKVMFNEESALANDQPSSDLPVFPGSPGYSAAWVALEQRVADILVVFSPDCIISSKGALARIVSLLPPTAFVTTWQERRKNKHN